MTDQRDNPVYMTDAYLHGLLSAKDIAYVERMIDEDEVWKLAYQNAVQRFEAMQQVPVVEAPSGLIERTITQVNNKAQAQMHWRRGVRWTAAAAVAASILILFTLNVYYLNLAPNPYDLRVMGQSTLQGGTSGSIRIVLTNYESGAVVPDASVDVVLSNPRTGESVELVSFKTDATGSGNPRFDLPDWASGDYELKVVARGREGKEELTRTIKLTRSWKLMVSTDKPVYQPGQMIHCRSLALRKPDLKPIAGESVEFSVSDPKGNVILRKTGVTSEFGIASIDCALADEILHGAYTVRCKVGDTESANTVEVREYVLPKFRVEMELDRSYYLPGDVVYGKVDAGYFFGKPVAGARVEVEVGFAGAYKQTIQVPSLKTDADGAAAFEVRLPEKLFGREQDGGDARMTVWLKVTDSAGQAQTREISRLVTNRPLRVQVIPESGKLVRNVENRVYVITTYADGQPAQTRLAVTGVPYEVQTNSLGVATIHLTPMSRQLHLTVRATDEAGLSVQETKQLELGKANDDYIVRTDKAVYRGGETVSIEAVGSGNAPIFLDLIKDDQTLLTESIAIENGQGKYAFDLPAEMSGTIRVVTYRFGSAGLPVQKSRTIYVDQANEVRISAETDKQVYRPGETASLRLKLTGTDGSPIRGAISLAAVDESVFSVLTQSPGSEKTFFSLEQELLQPVYAIYHWSPSVFLTAKESDRRMLELALFASTAQKVGYSRDALLQQLVDEGMISPDMLDAIDSPYFEQALESLDGMVSEDVIAILRGESDGLYSLQTRTYPSKKQRIEAERRRGLNTINTLWSIIGVLVFIAFIYLLIVMLPGSGRRPTIVEFLLVVSIIALLVGILLPALGAARHSARSLVAMSELRQMAIGLESLEDRGAENQTTSASEQHVRVRQWFPETLLWRPELITDDRGVVQLDVPLADSITSWRLSASAVTADGRLGGETSALRVFQPFFVDLDLPVSMTRGDEVGLPIVVYNYLDKQQDVSITVSGGDWFEFLGDARFELLLEPGEVRSIHCPIRVMRVGNHEVEVRADGSDLSDAIRREIEVRPDGRKIEQVVNGSLDEPGRIKLDVPSDAIDGSVVAVVKLHPSSFSQVVEGLDAIFQRPYGCFEQTSSTTYPNVLALDYLRRMNKNAPGVEAKAQQYIHLGYQRLLGFEVAGGGFDWFGRPPANRTLTAYGLMEFQDMARVHDVDPELIKRTRRWLMQQRGRDGGWKHSGHRMHQDPASINYLELSTTAYIAWAVFQNDRTDAAQTRDYLLRHSANSINDPYTLALVANALLAIDPGGNDARPYLERLVREAQISSNGKFVFWNRHNNTPTTFYGMGRSGDIETTATALLALIKSGTRPDLTRGGLAWLVNRKDSLGTWHTTQATVLSLKALLAGTGKPLGDGKNRMVDVEVNGARVDTLALTAEESDVIRQINVSQYLKTGKNQVVLRERTDTACGYQVVLRYHVQDAALPKQKQPLSIDIAYDDSELEVGDVLSAKATVLNNQDDEAPMVILDLPVPAGFTVNRDAFDRAVKQNIISKYQVTPRSTIVYLRGLKPGTPLELEYQLQATMPVKITAPAPKVYEYYNPDTNGSGQTQRLIVLPRA